MSGDVACIWNTRSNMSTYKLAGVHGLTLVSRVLLDLRFFELKGENEWVKDGHVETYPSKISAVDWLTVVSKAFMQTPVLELKRENERLKFELFWQTYSVDNMTRALRQYHARTSDIYCGCVSCQYHKRFEPRLGDEAEWTECDYQPWFEGFLGNADMDVGHGWDREHERVHFHVFGSMHGWWWVHGLRFTEARSVGNPELKKLQGMFETLYK